VNLSCSPRAYSSSRLSFQWGQLVSCTTFVWNLALSLPSRPPRTSQTQYGSDLPPASALRRPSAPRIATLIFTVAGGLCESSGPISALASTSISDANMESSCRLNLSANEAKLMPPLPRTCTWTLSLELLPLVPCSASSPSKPSAMNFELGSTT